MVVFKIIISSISEEASSQQSRRDSQDFGRRSAKENRTPFIFRKAWAEKLLYMSECLDGWLKVQRARGQGLAHLRLPLTEWYSTPRQSPILSYSQAWMYLQPIFDSPDIMKQLPTEGLESWRHCV